MPDLGIFGPLRMNRTLLTALALVAGLSALRSAAEIVETDVCVFGANSGGVTAAVQAARLGKSVVLISTNTHVGGMTSGGLGNTDTGNNAAIGGLALEFYERIGARYGVTGAKYTFEPHIAEEEFHAMLDAAGVPLRTNQRLAALAKDGQSITQITMEDGTIYRAGMFIDATYEGDLMAAAGVTWTLGRESSAAYGESFNGNGTGTNGLNFTVNVDPYLTPGDPASGLLPFIQAGDAGATGAADSKVQAYNYRLCLTSAPSNRRPITAPPGYSEARYELLGRLIDARIAAGQTITIYDFMTFGAMPNQKFDNNNNGAFSTDYIGGANSYPTAGYAEREQIAQEHLEYIQGFLYYLGHSARVPASVRSVMAGFGTCLDEFTDTGGWPHQIYVREARRMISDYVMLQQNCVGWRMPDDSIGLAAYTMDSHSVQRIVKSGLAWNEGVFQHTVHEPYRISYRSIVPRVGECENLLVPFALSASHVAFGSIRMEPVFMVLGQSAATAAAFALDAGAAVRQVDYAKLALQLAADGQVLTWGSAQPLGIVVDNSDQAAVTATGDWIIGSATEGYAGTNYLRDGNVLKGSKSILFTPAIPATGSYDIYLRWTSASNRATNVPVDVTHAGGTTTFTVNQRVNGGTWFKLTTAGPLVLPAGTSAGVLIRNDGTEGEVVADSVRFAPYTPPAATVQIVASDAVARELTPSDHARFTVVRPPDQTASDWSVNYSVSGTATPEADFAVLSGNVTIPSGQVAAVIDIAPVADDLPEGDETVTITLQPGAGYQVGEIDSATVKIIDKPAVQIIATDTVAREADGSDTARFTLSRDASHAANAWIVFYSVSGSAAAGADYTALPGSVTISAGETSATIDVTAIADDVAEGTETVTVTLQPSADFTPLAIASATVTILDKPMDDWRFAEFDAAQLADPAISGAEADPDGDGFNNMTEYALGLHPLTAEPAAATHSIDVTGHLTLTYLVRRAATALSVIAEGSGNLHTWSGGPEMVEEIARTPQGEFDVVTVRLVPLNPPSGFLRLRVVTP